MRLPSIARALATARLTAARFPFVLLCAFVAAGAGFVWVEDGQSDPLVRILLAGLLGIPLTFALATAAERRGLERGARMGAQLAGVAVAAVFLALSLFWTDTLLVTRFFHLALAFHLMVAFLAFVGAGKLRGFWQFNRILFLRFLLAALYSSVLYVGLALALLALDNLFGMDIGEEAYGHLFVLLALIVHPWFFLGGVPDDYDLLDERSDYPIGLKVFSQFVLIPLVTVYLLILTAYLVRIIVTSTWPSGWLGWLVSGVAVAGTLALLLVHPIRERDDAHWVNAYARWFYVGLLPSIAMLLMAIGQRIGQYGVTERRYFLLVLALWLAGIALYYGITGSRNIRTIPATLCLVALATLAGPWSAYAVSQRSQVGRFESYLEQYAMRDGEQIVAPSSQIPFEDRREMSAVVRYLVEVHGEGSLARIDERLAAAASAPDTLVIDPRTGIFPDSPGAERALAAIGVDYVGRYEADFYENRSFYSQAMAGLDSVDIRGFEAMYRVDLAQRTALPLRGDSLVIEALSNGILTVAWQGESAVAGSLIQLAYDVGTLPSPTDSIIAPPPLRGVLPIGTLSLSAQVGDLRIRILFSQLSGVVRESGELDISTAYAAVLVGAR